MLPDLALCLLYPCETSLRCSINSVSRYSSRQLVFCTRQRRSPMASTGDLRSANPETRKLTSTREVCPAPSVCRNGFTDSCESALTSVFEVGLFSALNAFTAANVLDATST